MLPPFSGTWAKSVFTITTSSMSRGFCSSLNSDLSSQNREKSPGPPGLCGKVTIWSARVSRSSGARAWKRRDSHLRLGPLRCLLNLSLGDGAPERQCWGCRERARCPDMPRRARSTCPRPSTAPRAPNSTPLARPVRTRQHRARIPVPGGRDFGPSATGWGSRSVRSQTRHGTTPGHRRGGTERSGIGPTNLPPITSLTKAVNFLGQLGVAHA